MKKEFKEFVREVRKFKDLLKQSDSAEEIKYEIEELVEEAIEEIQYEVNDLIGEIRASVDSEDYEEALSMLEGLSKVFGIGSVVKRLSRLVDRYYELAEEE